MNDNYYVAVEAARQLTVEELRQLADYCTSLADDRANDEQP